MSVRESLIKYMTSILRSSEGTLLVVLCDLDGLSIAKIGRKSDLEINPNQISSLASAAFSASEENWEDLEIMEQVVSFTFFDQVCLITIKINETLLTIVHDYYKEWPLDADNLASSMYYLKKNLGEFFGIQDQSEEEIINFSNKVRSAIYLYGMGSEVKFVSYAPEDYDDTNVLPAMSQILDSIQNPIFMRYCLANPSGLTLDAREVRGENLPISIDAFSANATVAFQKMKEESKQTTIGNLLCYIAISGEDEESFYGIITCPSGNLIFSEKGREDNIQEVSFIGLFPLVYGGIPVICETRNIIYSLLEILGTEKITEQLIKTINIITSSKYE